MESSDESSVPFLTGHSPAIDKRECQISPGGTHGLRGHYSRRSSVHFLLGLCALLLLLTNFVTVLIMRFSQSIHLDKVCALHTSQSWSESSRWCLGSSDIFCNPTPSPSSPNQNLQTLWPALQMHSTSPPAVCSMLTTSYQHLCSLMSLSPTHPRPSMARSSTKTYIGKRQARTWTRRGMLLEATVSKRARSIHTIRGSSE